MTQIQKTNVITNTKELQNKREEFLTKLETYQEKINEVKKIITKYPKDKKSFELASDILCLKEQVTEEYQGLINKGGLLTSKNSIQRIINNLEAAHKVVKENSDDIEFTQEIFKQYKEELLKLQNKDVIILPKAFDEYIASLLYRITDLIWHWKIDSQENDTFDISIYNIEKYFEFYIKCNRHYNYKLENENFGQINAPKFAFFELEEHFDQIQDKIYESMHALFKDYYYNEEVRTPKFTKEEKEKHQIEEDVIISTPNFKEEYQNYKHLRKNGKTKNIISPIEKFMAENEYGKPKQKSLTYPYKQ